MYSSDTKAADESRVSSFPEEPAPGGLLWSEQFQLAALPVDTLVRIGLFSVAATLSSFSYHFLGNTTDINMYGQSAIRWMIARWKPDPSYGGDYSHGYLIPRVDPPSWP
ncbi:MAG: hypothetical protein U1F87_08075 [Kiritimatiellia bacterium]